MGFEQGLENAAGDEGVIYEAEEEARRRRRVLARAQRVKTPPDAREHALLRRVVDHHAQPDRRDTVLC
jgi:hypothetical protein